MSQNSAKRTCFCDIGVDVTNALKKKNESTGADSFKLFTNYCTKLPVNSRHFVRAVGLFQFLTEEQDIPF